MGRALAIGFAFVAVVAAGLALSRAVFQPGQYRVTVPVQNAAGLYAGSDVMIAGARAGRVDDIVLRGGAAMVTMEIDPERAPLRRDATVAVRPKSLLGERYLALDPGQAPASLPSGATLPATSVTRSVDLEDVVSTFDQPTRDKLQTLVVELGGGVAGRGSELNQGLAAGRQDAQDLRGIADALARRDAELQDVIANLDSVTQELARSDRRQQLAVLVQNLEALIRNLADQDAQLKVALSETNAALGRTATALDGTGGSLAGVVRQVPATVHLADLLLADLAVDSDALMPHLAQLNTAIAEGPSVMGGRDASGFATRISPIVGCSTVSLCPQALGAGTPAAAAPQVAVPPVAASTPGAAPEQAPGLPGSLIDFLLGRQSP